MEQLLELARERKLDRVGATYAVVAWILVQAASIALPAFNAPPWGLRWLIVAAMIGFPLVLVLAWLNYGRAPAASSTAKPFEGKDWLLTGLIGLVAVLLIVQLAFDYRWHHVSASPENSSTPVVAASSIAVLPFANLSGDPKKVYFSDGIADQLISELARTPSLRVAARSSSFAFRGKDVDVKAIARALNVRAVLEGSVREDGKRVRIAAELVDAANGFQIWSESYDRNLTDILSLQDDIAHAITEAVAQRFLGHTVAANRAPKPRPIDPEAYKSYLQGQYYFAQRTKEGILRAIDLFTRTTALAPQYADGFAALADAHATAALDFQVPGAVPAALDAVNKALALDANNPTAIMARVTVELLQWRWRAAAADMRRLEQLHVNSAAVWHMRAIFFDYMGLAQFCGAAEEQAIKLDPLSFIDHYNLALYRMREGRFDEAARVAAQAWALQPGNPDLQQVNVQIALGKHDMKGAEQILSRLIAQVGEDSPYTAAARFFILVAKKDYPAARKFVDSVAKRFPSSDITANDLGIAYALTDDMDKAMMWFRRAVDLHEAQFLPVTYTNPLPAEVYADPRWKALRAQPEVRDWEDARREIATEFQAGE